MNALTVAVHCSESVDALVAQHELDPSAVAILLRLWLESRDPYAVGPVVTMSAPALARAVRLSEDRARRHLAKLRSCGAVEAIGNGGAVRRYRLRRPAAHEAANAAAAEAAAARAAKREADKDKPVKVDDSNRKRKEWLVEHGIRRDEISSALCSAFGLAKSAIKYTGGEVNAAIDWMIQIADDPFEEFRAVLTLAAKSDSKPQHPERLFYAEHREWVDSL